LFRGSDKALLVDSGFGTGNIKKAVAALTELPVMLVNTHADRDHTGCNAMFDKAFMHPAEYDRYHQSDGAGLPVGPLWEGSVIDLGGRSFEVILIPGHTPGSIALLDAENRILISGDSIQSGTVFMFGPGRNLDAYIESMEKLYGIRDRFDTVYPSHGPFPVSADILGGLISGARLLREGGLKPAKAPFETSAQLYDGGVAKFLY
jgi:glyoxylase-like metal-dependent hydrolase (beta-lactamase superfamily II)